jgi:hypothetical protein
MPSVGGPFSGTGLLVPRLKRTGHSFGAPGFHPDAFAKGENVMKTCFAVLLAAASILPLAACNKSPSDKLAGRVENAANNRADAMEANADALRNQAAMLDNRAEKARDTGESRADAIKAADMNVAAMSQERRDAIVANQAAAVR